MHATLLRTSEPLGPAVTVMGGAVAAAIDPTAGVGRLLLGRHTLSLERGRHQQQ